MARSRDAVDTIKGYYYQFDYFIFQLISLVNEEDTVTIEGIEDVDILEEKEMVAVQCIMQKQNIIIRLLQNQLGLC